MDGKLSNKEFSVLWENLFCLWFFFLFGFFFFLVEMGQYFLIPRLNVSDEFWCLCLSLVQKAKYLEPFPLEKVEESFLNPYGIQNPFT